jgi:diguanylate cyclase (GGDEF)-like protein/PAS domain S-box-containing protein
MDNILLEAFLHDKPQEKFNAMPRLYKAIFDVAGTAMTLIAEDHTILYANKEMERLSGYSLDEIAGKQTFHQFIHPKDLPRIIKYHSQRHSMENNPPNSYTFTFLSARGLQKEVMIKATLLPGTEITIAALTDLTEMSLLQQKLRRSEDKFRQLFENVQEGIYQSSIDGKLLLANPALVKMLGYPSFDSLRDLTLGEDIYVDNNVRKALIALVDQKGIFSNFEMDWKRKDGSVITVRANGRVIKDENDKFLCFETSVMDITQIKEAHAKLESSRTYFKNIIKYLPDPTFAINTEGVVVAWNKAMEQLTGVTEQAIHGCSNYEYAIPLYGERRPVMVDYVLNPELHSGKQYSFLHKEGSTVIGEAFAPMLRNGQGAYLWGSASPIRDADGTIIGAINTIKDFTEYKETQKQLKFFSIHDVLTGLYNRSYFEEEVDRLNNMRFSPISVIMCDVDGLKLINDSLGHYKGDELLKAAADAIQTAFRTSDAVARIGGDEFVVILPNTDQNAAEEAVIRISKAVDDYNIINPTFPLSLSTGFATGEPPLQNILIEADNNLNRNKLHRSASAKSHLTTTLMTMLAERDFVTEGHAERLEKMAATMADAAGLSSRDKSDLILLAKFHDIGKVGISDKLLFKPGALTSRERDEMKRHSEIGYRISQSSPNLSHISNFILHHHEWWNGTGYPLGLKGEEIPLHCRILSILDTFDAMTSDRPYRKAEPTEEAISYIKKASGSQFDPSLVEIFLTTV